MRKGVFNDRRQPIGVLPYPYSKLDFPAIGAEWGLFIFLGIGHAALIPVRSEEQHNTSFLGGIFSARSGYERMENSLRDGDGPIIREVLKATADLSMKLACAYAESEALVNAFLPKWCQQESDFIFSLFHSRTRR